MVEGKGGEHLNKELDVRCSHGGRQGCGSLNTELDFRWSHGGRQRGEKNEIKSYISDGRMVEGKGGGLNKDFDFRWSHGGRQRVRKFK